MSRPPRCRRVAFEPRATVFKPAGIPACELEAVEIGLDELEALRLADLEGLYHDAAAERMGVSRPTFGRLVERARQKVATALLGSKMIVFSGGPVMNPIERTFQCAACGARFEVPHGQPRPGECPSCRSLEFHRTAAGESPESAAGPGCRRRRRHRSRMAAGTDLGSETAAGEALADRTAIDADQQGGTGAGAGRRGRGRGRGRCMRGRQRVRARGIPAAEVGGGGVVRIVDEQPEPAVEPVVNDENENNNKEPS